ncbi:MAG: cell division topological specificity factor MinE [Gammaproteobacteria bacterium]
MNFQKLIDYFKSTPTNTASVAKERLQIVISHERDRAQPHQKHDFLPLLQKELLAVISKYFPVDEEQVRVELAKTGDLSILELNITLPDAGKTFSTDTGTKSKARRRMEPTR